MIQLDAGDELFISCSFSASEHPGPCHLAYQPYSHMNDARTQRAEGSVLGTAGDGGSGLSQVWPSCNACYWLFGPQISIFHDNIFALIAELWSSSVAFQRGVALVELV